MRGHVRKRGAGWAFVVDVDDQRAQRCEACSKRAWVERERPSEACPTCGGQLGEPRPERRQVWRSGFSTRKAAERALRSLIATAEAGGDPLPQDQTVREWTERWLASPRVTRLRPHTQSRYRQVLADHVLPTVGSMQLAAVRPRHVQAVLDDVGGKGLSARSVGEAKAVLSSALRAAVEAELIDANPAAGVRAPKPARRELTVPTTGQLVALLDAARGGTWEVPLLLAATTGARRSEVLALTWRHVDLDAGRLEVVASLQRVRDEDGSRLQLLEPKTDRARRQITLPQLALDRLRRWKAEQAERRLRLGPAWTDAYGDLVCDRGDGGPLDPDSFSTGFKRLIDQAGLDRRTRLHDVRHAVATAMLDQGVHPAIASAVLGHASTAFTMNTYQHVLDGMTDRAAAALDQVLGGT